uniref:Uncharacterized protein n=1 Tax=Anguilla anguilla TaxID=7936 RepID=A0A0E9P5C7_ANGAN
MKELAWYRSFLPITIGPTGREKDCSSHFNKLLEIC